MYASGPITLIDNMINVIGFFLGGMLSALALLTLSGCRRSLGDTMEGGGAPVSVSLTVSAPSLCYGTAPGNAIRLRTYTPIWHLLRRLWYRSIMSLTSNGCRSCPAIRRRLSQSCPMLLLAAAANSLLRRERLRETSRSEARSNSSSVTRQG